MILNKLQFFLNLAISYVISTPIRRMLILINRNDRFPVGRFEHYFLCCHHFFLFTEKAMKFFFYKRRINNYFQKRYEIPRETGKKCFFQLAIFGIISTLFNFKQQ